MVVVWWSHRQDSEWILGERALGDVSAPSAADDDPFAQVDIHQYTMTSDIILTLFLFPSLTSTNAVTAVPDRVVGKFSPFLNYAALLDGSC